MECAFNPEALISFFEARVNRSKNACIRGVLSLVISDFKNGKSSGTNVGLQSTYREKPCTTPIVLYRLEIQSKLIGYVLFDENETLCIFLERPPRWDQLKGMILNLVNDLVNQMENSRPFSDLLFREQPFPRGLLYLVLRIFGVTLFETSLENPDDLIDFIQKLSQEMTNQLFCDLVKQAEQKKVIVSVAQPTEVENVLIHEAKDLGLECAGIDELLDTAQLQSCQNVFDTKTYSRYSPYVSHFIHQLTDSVANTCDGGEVEVWYNPLNKKAQVTDSTLHLLCRANDLIVVLIHLVMGDLDPADPTRMQELEDRNELDHHAMVLLLDNRRHQIELFEPNGASPEWVPFVFDALQSFFQQAQHYKQYVQDYEWFETQEFCPRVGLQGLSTTQREYHTKSGGFCSYFSLLWIYLRLHCQDIDRKTLLIQLLKGGGTFIDRLIVGLQCKLAAFSRQQKA